MELRKSYKGFVAWVIGFVAVLLGLCFLRTEDVGLLMRLICCACAVGIAVLAYIIYRTGYVYWYNGIEYEDAVRAGEARRRAYALTHFKRFGGFAAAFVLFSIVMHGLGWSYWIDFAVASVGIIATAVGTIRVKL